MSRRRRHAEPPRSRRQPTTSTSSPRQRSAAARVALIVVGVIAGIVAFGPARRRVRARRGRPDAARRRRLPHVAERGLLDADVRDRVGERRARHGRRGVGARHVPRHGPHPQRQRASLCSSASRRPPTSTATSRASSTTSSTISTRAEIPSTRDARDAPRPRLRAADVLGRVRHPGQGSRPSTGSPRTALAVVGDERRRLAGRVVGHEHRRGARLRPLDRHRAARRRRAPRRGRCARDHRRRAPRDS